MQKETHRQNLLVIGNGMVSCHFCTQFVVKGMNDKYQLTVFGDEPRPAYDRVHLTSYAEHRNLKKLELKPRQWYKDNNIDLHTGEEVLAIDRENKVIKTSKGKIFSYDKLILATGSSPFVPPIPGKDLEGVFTYRTYKDVDNIIDFCSKSRIAVVAGGGLLGLEAADFLKRMGLKTHIVELADYLLPRQLDIKGAKVFKAKIMDKGFTIHNGNKINQICKNSDGSLGVQLSSGEEINADVTIISAGIRSNSELAQKAGIECSPAKGVIVDSRLQTSDENIFAIGECARYKEMLYGLVAPGYKMAEIVLKRLNGEDAKFTGADMSTRLKMLGEDVISLGDALQPEKSYEFEKEGIYRKLLHSKSRGLAGAVGVGEWPEAGQIQGAISSNMPLNNKELERFKKTGSLWEDQNDITKWPDNTVICNCMRLTKAAIIETINKGCNKASEVAAATGASTICGSCDIYIQKLCGNNSIEPRSKPEKILLTVSFLTLCTALGIIFTPTLWSAESIGGSPFTEIFMDSFYRQVTGFSLLFLTLCACLISLRKRWKKFTFGSFKVWRIAHGMIGLLSLIILIFHTGLSAGKNLNMALFTLFTTINILGFITGVATSFEFFGLNKISAFCRRWRKQITLMHILAFWPLPVLITFHIIQAYYF